VAVLRQSSGCSWMFSKSPAEVSWARGFIQLKMWKRQRCCYQAAWVLTMASADDSPERVLLCWLRWVLPPRVLVLVCSLV